MATRLDGAALAREIRAEVKEETGRLRAEYGVPPTLVVILVGEAPASSIYVRNKARACEEVGIRSEVIHAADKITEIDLKARIQALNQREDVDGILVQLPLPGHLDEPAIISLIDPAKDVDGLHAINVGRLVRKEPGLVSCTPAGILRLLHRNSIPIEGRRAVVLGRSNLVGKPTAFLLLHEHATVTICHSRTRDLARITSEADILVVAIGRPAMVTEQFVRPGATVIDVGIHRLETEKEVLEIFKGVPEKIEAFHRNRFLLVGDVHPVRVPPVAGALSPVPGGVGPLTVAMLLANTVKAARMRRIGLPPARN